MLWLRRRRFGALMRQLTPCHCDSIDIACTFAESLSWMSQPETATRMQSGSSNHHIKDGSSAPKKKKKKKKKKKMVMVMMMMMKMQDDEMQHAWGQMAVAK